MPIMPMRGDEPRQGGALGVIRHWPSLVRRERLDFASRRKLDCVCRKKRILLVAFSRQTAGQNSSMFYFTARVKGLVLKSEFGEIPPSGSSLGTTILIGWSFYRASKA